MKIAGKATIRLDGVVVAAENKATLNPGGVNREPESHGGKTFYSEEDVPPLLELSVLVTKETDVIALSRMVGATVLFEADTGQKFMLRDAFATEPVVFDSAGKTPLKMSAQAAEPL